MAMIVGNYERVSKKNTDAYLEKLGVSFPLRKLCLLLGFNPNIKITHEDGVWTIIRTTHRTKIQQFKLDEPFCDVSCDGREITGVVNVTENKMVTIETANNDGEPSTRIERTFSFDGFYQTSQIIHTRIG